jgi:lipopolysaccharide heptosyltransferase II
MSKLQLLKVIDGIAGRVLARLLRRPKSKHSDTCRRILFIRPGGIGDAVLMIYAVNRLRQKFLEAEVTVLGEKRNVSAFGLCPYLNQVLRYDSPKELFTAVRGEYDVIIDSEQWHRLSAVLARLAKSSVSIGYATNVRNKMFTHDVQYSHEDYELDSFLHLLEPLGIRRSINAKQPYLVVPAEAREKAKCFLGELSDKPFVAIFPGASIPEKQWDVKKFAKLATEINKAGYQIVVIGSEKERAAGEEIVRGFNSFNLAGKTSLVETAAIIDKSSLLVSGDSGVLHIAAGLEKLTVSLFGPSNVKKWAPRGDKHIVVTKNLSCSPCSKFGYTPKCPLNAKCMQDITVDEVVAAVMKLMV